MSSYLLSTTFFTNETQAMQHQWKMGMYLKKSYIEIKNFIWSQSMRES